MATQQPNEQRNPGGDTVRRVHISVMIVPALGEADGAIWTHYRRAVYGAPQLEDFAGPWLSTHTGCVRCHRHWIAVVQAGTIARECPYCGFVETPAHWDWPDEADPIQTTG